MVKNSIIFLFIFCISIAVNGQELIQDGETEILLKKEYAIGLAAQSAGILAINFRKGTQKTVTIKNYWELEIANLQHPKEFADPRFNFIFKPGKVNTVWTLRATYGKQKELAEKVFGGIGLKWTYLGGVSAALVKPIFVEVNHTHAHAVNQNHDAVIEQYNPSEHSIGSIVTKESYFVGLDKAKFHPGLFVKTGLFFDYSPYKTKVRGLEIGLTADYYLKELPIMASISNDNSKLYWAFYVNFLWGKKW